MTTLTLAGRTAIVAGGSAGIGRAIVTALRAEGMNVGVIARDTDRLAQIEAEEGALGGTARIATASADVADAAALEAAGDALAASLGPPDVWINCAMQTAFSPFEQMPPEEFDRIVAVTLIGQVNGCRAALRLMPKDDGRTRRIVNIGSGLAYRSVPFQSAYCAAKHGINGFTASLRSELMRQDRPVTLSLVQLPAVNTPQFDWARNRLDRMPQPAPPIYAPDAVARAVVRAVRDGPRELLVGQSVLKLVLGHLVAPDWLDRKMAEAGADLQKSGRDEPGDRPDNLDAPVPYPARAEGSFSDRQKDRVLILDGGWTRLAVFGGVPLLLFLLGLALG